MGSTCWGTSNPHWHGTSLRSLWRWTRRRFWAGFFQVDVAAGSALWCLIWSSWRSWPSRPHSYVWRMSHPVGIKAWSFWDFVNVRVLSFWVTPWPWVSRCLPSWTSWLSEKGWGGACGKADTSLVLNWLRIFWRRLWRQCFHGRSSTTSWACAAWMILVPPNLVVVQKVGFQSKSLEQFSQRSRLWGFDNCAQSGQIDPGSLCS